MKNLLLITIIIASVISVNAQKYSPFDTTNINWNEFYETEDTEHLSILGYFISGDTLILDDSYHKIFRASDFDTVYIGAFRESNKEIFYIGQDYWGFDTYTPVVLYDFTQNIGDTIHTGTFHRNIILDIDSIPVSEGHRKRFKMYDDQYWIEGIGSTRGFLYPITDIPTMYWRSELICFKRNEDVIYLNPGFTDCTTRIVSSQFDVEVEDRVEIYPNPVEREGILSLQTYDSPIVGVRLYNQLGLLLSIANCNDKGKMQMDIGNYASGVYILLVFKSDQEIINMKVVIK